MEHASPPLDTRRYAKCIEVSKRIRWDLERDVIRERTFDFSHKFLPDGLSLADRLRFLSTDERRLLSQVQGRTYANMLGLGADRGAGGAGRNILSGAGMSPLSHTAFPPPAPAGKRDPLILPGLIAMGDGPAVVLLHSSMSSKTQWSALMQRLAPQYRAIAVDLNGYGDNVLPRQHRDFSLDDEVDLVTSRLQSVTARNTPVHLVGHSYGGLVALRFAQRYPALVRGLSLFEPVAFSLFDAGDPHADEVRSLAATVAERVGAHREMDAAEAFVDYWCGTGAFAPMSLPMKARCAGHARKVVLDFTAAFGCGLTLADCRAIRARTLLLGGTRSRDVAQRIVTKLATALPNSRSAWIHGDHMAPVNAGDRVNPLFEAFIDMNEARFRSAATANGNRVGAMAVG